MIFMLFACCRPVKGYNRSVICDLQRNEVYFIPDGLHEILTTHKNKTSSEIKKACQNEHDEIIDGYFRFLLENELGFYTDDPERFPELTMDFDTPELINNAIIDIDNNSRHDFSLISRQLFSLRCKFLEIRFYDHCTLLDVSTMLKELTENDNCLRNVDLYIKYFSTLNLALLDELTLKNPLIGRLYLHSFPVGLTHQFTALNIYPLEQEIVSESCCGNIGQHYFSVNTEHFLEALHFNTCLHKKISIDKNGHIKNCPSFTTSYGKIGTVSLEAVASNQQFRQYGTITKDNTAVCKDCEFRYICSDCRAYLLNPEDMFSKPLKCGYDPYTSTWQPH